MLMLEGYNANLESDSFSAIQRDSKKASHPWKLVGWVS